MRVDAMDRVSARIPEELLEAERAWELDPGVLLLARELVALVGGAGGSLEAEEGRALLFLVAAALVNQRRGSTRLPLAGGVLGGLLADLGAAEADRRAVGRLLDEARGGSSRLRSIFGGPDDYKPLLLDGGQLYIQRMYRAEQELVRSLDGRMRAGLQGASGAKEIEEVLGEVLAAPPAPGGKAIELSDEQEEAVRKALSLPLAVISGGPGTGKTSIVVSILRALVRLGIRPERIALAAPTGKAANRMAESIGRTLATLVDPCQADRALIDAGLEPRTLHRLLAWSPAAARFRHHERNPLLEDVVIVDEGSMIDLVLMERLLRALRPEARLILLGDAEQLPSVDAGAVLRDLLPGSDPDDRRARFSARLSRSYRMDARDPAGRNILLVARAINEGRSVPFVGEADAAVGDPDEAIGSRGAAEELTFEKVEHLQTSTPAALGAFLDRWFVEQVTGLEGFTQLVRREYLRKDGAFVPGDEEALRRLFAHFEGRRLLCVTRHGAAPTGVEAVNARLHQLFGEAFGGDAAFLPGEPVMMQRNDYERGLFNGDQGLILRVRESGEGGHHFRAVFPAGPGFASFHLDGLRGQLSLSYAMTVHKAQGSEFHTVGLILPETPIPLLTREILYTAVTRSRRSVVVVGRREVLAAGAQRRLERHSGIGEALGAA